MDRAMKQCARCGRFHTGLCSIPAGDSSKTIKNKLKPIKKGTNVLEKLLEESLRREKEVTHLLTVVPSELPEYTQLLDRLSKLKDIILQLNRQIAERR